MTQPKIRELVEKAQAQDKEALALLVEQFKPLIYSRSKDEDTRQSLFLTLIEAIKKFKYENPYDFDQYIQEVLEKYLS
jgi:DNA-directed RNA polymerase specialized sigma subunit